MEKLTVKSENLTASSNKIMILRVSTFDVLSCNKLSGEI
jgi:hypothetical protein